MVHALLRMAGIDVNLPDSFGLTPLLWASVGGHTEVVQALLRAPGVDMNRADNQGQTPLHFACACCRLEVATMLVEAGAEVNSRDSNGESPLEVLCHGCGGVENCVQLLRGAAGPILKVLRLGGLPERIAADMAMECLCGRQRMAAMLLRAGANVLSDHPHIPFRPGLKGNVLCHG